MITTGEGLEVTDKELRALVFVNKALNGWKCYVSGCEYCSFRTEEHICKMLELTQLFNELMDIVIAL